VLGEIPRDTPAHSPLTVKDVMGREDYRELMTAKLRVGDRAVDFELPQHDFSHGLGHGHGHHRAPVRLP
jgi:hypothetical protein